MKKTYKVLFIILLAAILLGFLVQSLFFRQAFLYAGTLEATKVDLSARLDAAIHDIAVQEGDRVNDNQTLIRFDCENYKVTARQARNNYNRYIQLLKQKYTSPETIDQYQTALDEALINVQWCELQSPITGTVLSRYHEPGEWMQAGTKILTLANIKDIWAYIYVPQPVVAKLSYGMKLKAILPELNNQIFYGTIIKINEEAEFTPKNVQTQSERERLIYGVKISFLGSNDSEILKPGMTVEVEAPNQNP